MISKIVELEQERYKRLGYDTIVVPISIYVSSPLEVVHISNDSYILTGIHITRDDMLSNGNSVVLSSPTEVLHLTQMQISQLGTSLFKLFKENLIIQTKSESDFGQYRLDFIKITPYLNK